MTRRGALLGTLTVMLLLGPGDADSATRYAERTEWIMGTTLRIVLPADREPLFATCFAEARRWDALLSPWRDEAPLSRLSAGAGRWIDVPADVLDYLERAVRDAERSGNVFDITLSWQGSRRIEIDRVHGRARLPAGCGPLDPGADGKGVALDAVAAMLDRAGVSDALLDFGNSSLMARGGGPDGGGWKVALAGPSGEQVGILVLRDTALSVSSTVRRDHREDGSVIERHHLRDLRHGEVVSDRRVVAVLASSATEAEVLSTTLAITGPGGLAVDGGRTLLAAFPDCAAGIFPAGEAAAVLRGGFADQLRRAASGGAP